MVNKTEPKMCPMCGNIDTNKMEKVGTSFDVNLHRFTESLKCGECSANWIDVYDVVYTGFEYGV